MILYLGPCLRLALVIKTIVCTLETRRFPYLRPVFDVLN